MDNNELLILGLLGEQEQHGYQISEFIDKNLGRLTVMKRPTAYATLDRLHKQGHVSVRVEQPGNRAPRKIYALTPQGERHFLDLLRINLSATLLGSSSDIGLLFVDHLPRKEVIDTLSNRLSELDELLTLHEGVPQHGHGVGVDLALDHFTAILRAERDWLATVLPRLSRRARTGKKS